MRFWPFCYAAFFLTLGIWGIFSFTPFGIFEVNGWQILLYLVTGGCALSTLFAKRAWKHLYFQVVGIIYGIIAIGGFALLDREMLFFLANNSNNTWLAVCTAVVALILGFKR